MTLLSSTMPIRVITSARRDGELDRGSVAVFAGDIELAAKTLDAGLHIGDAIHALALDAAGQAAAVIGDDYLQIPVSGVDAQTNLSRAGMTDDIGKGFLESEEQFVPAAGIQLAGVRSGCLLQLPADVGQTQESLGIKAEIAYQRVQ